MQPMSQGSTRMQTMPVTCLVMPPARAMHVAPHHMAGRKGMSEAPSVTFVLNSTLTSLANPGLAGTEK